MIYDIPLPSPGDMELRMLESHLVGGVVAYRVSRDGKVTFLTEQEYNALWEESEKKFG